MRPLFRSLISFSFLFLISFAFTACSEDDKVINLTSAPPSEADTAAEEGKDVDAVIEEGDVSVPAANVGNLSTQLAAGSRVNIRTVQTLTQNPSFQSSVQGIDTFSDTVQIKVLTSDGADISTQTLAEPAIVRVKYNKTAITASGIAVESLILYQQKESGTLVPLVYVAPGEDDVLANLVANTNFTLDEENEYAVCKVTSFSSFVLGSAPEIAAFSVESVSVTPSIVNQGQNGVTVDVKVKNVGGGTVLLGSNPVSFGFAATTGATVSGISPTAVSTNPTSINPDKTQTLKYTFNFASDATAGAIQVDVDSITGTDKFRQQIGAITQTVTSTDGATTPGQVDVRIPVTLTVTAVEVGSGFTATANQGDGIDNTSSLKLTVYVRNDGTNSANTPAATFTFTLDAGGSNEADVTSSYTVTAQSVGAMLFPGVTTPLVYNATVSRTARKGSVTVNAAVTANDGLDNSQKTANSTSLAAGTTKPLLTIASTTGANVGSLSASSMVKGQSSHSATFSVDVNSNYDSITIADANAFSASFAVGSSDASSLFTGVTFARASGSFPVTITAGSSENFTVTFAPSVSVVSGATYTISVALNTFKNSANDDVLSGMGDSSNFSVTSPSISAATRTNVPGDTVLGGAVVSGEPIQVSFSGFKLSGTTDNTVSNYSITFGGSASFNPSSVDSGAGTLTFNAPADTGTGAIVIVYTGDGTQTATSSANVTGLIVPTISSVVSTSRSNADVTSTGGASAVGETLRITLTNFPGLSGLSSAANFLANGSITVGTYTVVSGDITGFSASSGTIDVLLSSSFVATTPTLLVTLYSQTTGVSLSSITSPAISTVQTVGRGASSTAFNSGSDVDATTNAVGVGEKLLVTLNTSAFQGVSSATASDYTVTLGTVSVTASSVSATGFNVTVPASTTSNVLSVTLLGQTGTATLSSITNPVGGITLRTLDRGSVTDVFETNDVDATSNPVGVGEEIEVVLNSANFSGVNGATAANYTVTIGSASVTPTVSSTGFKFTLPASAAGSAVSFSVNLFGQAESTSFNTITSPASGISFVRTIIRGSSSTAFNVDADVSALANPIGEGETVSVILNTSLFQGVTSANAGNYTVTFGGTTATVTATTTGFTCAIPTGATTSATNELSVNLFGQTATATLYQITDPASGTPTVTTTGRTTNVDASSNAVGIGESISVVLSTSAFQGLSVGTSAGYTVTIGGQTATVTATTTGFTTTIPSGASSTSMSISFNGQSDTFTFSSITTAGAGTSTVTTARGSDALTTATGQGETVSVVLDTSLWSGVNGAASSNYTVTIGTVSVSVTATTTGFTAVVPTGTSSNVVAINLFGQSSSITLSGIVDPTGGVTSVMTTGRNTSVSAAANPVGVGETLTVVLNTANFQGVATAIASNYTVTLGGVSVTVTPDATGFTFVVPSGTSGTTLSVNLHGQTATFSFNVIQTPTGGVSTVRTLNRGATAGTFDPGTDVSALSNAVGEGEVLDVTLSTSNFAGVSTAVAGDYTVTVGGQSATVTATATGFTCPVPDGTTSTTLSVNLYGQTATATLNQITDPSSGVQTVRTIDRGSVTGVYDTGDVNAASAAVGKTENIEVVLDTSRFQGVSLASASNYTVTIGGTAVVVTKTSTGFTTQVPASTSDSILSVNLSGQLDSFTFFSIVNPDSGISTVRTLGRGASATAYNSGVGEDVDATGASVGEGESIEVVLDTNEFAGVASAIAANYTVTTSGVSVSNLAATTTGFTFTVPSGAAAAFGGNQNLSVTLFGQTDAIALSGITNPTGGVTSVNTTGRTANVDATANATGVGETFQVVLNTGNFQGVATAIASNYTVTLGGVSVTVTADATGFTATVPSGTSSTTLSVNLFGQVATTTFNSITNPSGGVTTVRTIARGTNVGSFDSGKDVNALTTAVGEGESIQVVLDTAKFSGVNGAVVGDYTVTIGGQAATVTPDATGFTCPIPDSTSNVTLSINLFGQTASATLASITDPDAGGSEGLASAYTIARGSNASLFDNGLDVTTSGNAIGIGESIRVELDTGKFQGVASALAANYSVKVGGSAGTDVTGLAVTSNGFTATIPAGTSGQTDLYVSLYGQTATNTVFNSITDPGDSGVSAVADTSSGGDDLSGAGVGIGESVSVTIDTAKMQTASASSSNFSVTIGGSAATVTAWSSPTLTVTVPTPSAGTDLVVAVYGQSDTFTLNSITDPGASGITAAADVNSGTDDLSGAGAGIGESITLTLDVAKFNVHGGTVFGDFTVTIGGAAATETAWVSPNLTVTVPTPSAGTDAVVTVYGQTDTFTLNSITDPGASGITGIVDTQSGGDNLGSNEVGVGESVDVTLDVAKFQVHGGTVFGDFTVTVGGASATTTAWVSPTLTVTVPTPSSGSDVVVSVYGQSDTFTLNGITNPGSNGVSAVLDKNSGSHNLASNAVALGESANITIDIGKFQVSPATVAGDFTVTVDSQAATVSSWTQPTLEIVVPLAATAGASKTLSVTIYGQNDTFTLSSIVDPGDTGITAVVDVNTGGDDLVAANDASIGESVKATLDVAKFMVTGAAMGNFTVTIDGNVATVTAWSSPDLTVTVPAGSAGSADLIVTIWGQTDTVTLSNIVTPAIAGAVDVNSGGDDLAANNAAIGESINVTFTNFQFSTAEVFGDFTVTIGGAAATTTAWDGTTLTVTVPTPTAGSTLSVSIHGQTATLALNGISDPGATGITGVVDVNSGGNDLSSNGVGIGESINVTLDVAKFLVHGGTVFGDFTVTIGGAAATATAWVSPTLTVTVPTPSSGSNLIVTVYGQTDTFALSSVTDPGASGVSAVADKNSGAGNLASTAVALGESINITIDVTKFQVHGGTVMGDFTVTIDSQAATVSAWSSPTLEVVVPAAATAGASKSLSVTVYGQNDTFTLSSITDPGDSGITLVADVNTGTSNLSLVGIDTLQGETIRFTLDTAKFQLTGAVFGNFTVSFDDGSASNGTTTAFTFGTGALDVVVPSDALGPTTVSVTIWGQTDSITLDEVVAPTLTVTDVDTLSRSTNVDIAMGTGNEAVEGEKLQITVDSTGFLDLTAADTVQVIFSDDNTFTDAIDITMTGTALTASTLSVYAPPGTGDSTQGYIQLKVVEGVDTYTDDQQIEPIVAPNVTGVTAPNRSGAPSVLGGGIGVGESINVTIDSTFDSGATGFATSGYAQSDLKVVLQTQTVVLTGTPADAETVVLNYSGQTQETYTFDATPAAANDVDTSSASAATIGNVLAARINGNSVFAWARSDGAGTVRVFVRASIISGSNVLAITSTGNTNFTTTSYAVNATVNSLSSGVVNFTAPTPASGGSTYSIVQYVREQVVASANTTTLITPIAYQIQTLKRGTTSTAAESTGVRETATMTIAASTAPTDAETFAITDSVSSTTYTFEFDVSGNGVTSGNISIDASSSPTGTTLRDLIISSINNDAGAKKIFYAYSASTTTLVVTTVSTSTAQTGALAESSGAIASWSVANFVDTADGIHTDDVFAVQQTQAGSNSGAVNGSRRVAQGIAVGEIVEFVLYGMQGVISGTGTPSVTFGGIAASVQVTQATTSNIAKVKATVPVGSQGNDVAVVLSLNGQSVSSITFDTITVPTILSTEITTGLNVGSDATTALVSKGGVVRLLVSGFNFSVTGATNATATITTDTFANLTDTETFVLYDGVAGKSYTFEIDKAGDGVTAGRVQVNISADTTAADVSARITTAINSGVGSTGDTPSTAFSATDGAGTVTVTTLSQGSETNTTSQNTEASAAGAFAITQFASGSGAFTGFTVGGGADADYEGDAVNLTNVNGAQITTVDAAATTSTPNSYYIDLTMPSSTSGVNLPLNLIIFGQSAAITIFGINSNPTIATLRTLSRGTNATTFDSGESDSSTNDINLSDSNTVCPGELIQITVADFDNQGAALTLNNWTMTIGGWNNGGNNNFTQLEADDIIDVEDAGGTAIALNIYLVIPSNDAALISQSNLDITIQETGASQSAVANFGDTSALLSVTSITDKLNGADVTAAATGFAHVWEVVFGGVQGVASTGTSTTGGAVSTGFPVIWLDHDNADQDLTDATEQLVSTTDTVVSSITAQSAGTYRFHLDEADADLLAGGFNATANAVGIAFEFNKGTNTFDNNALTWGINRLSAVTDFANSDEDAVINDINYAPYITSIEVLDETDGDGLLPMTETISTTTADTTITADATNKIAEGEYIKVGVRGFLDQTNGGNWVVANLDVFFDGVAIDAVASPAPATSATIDATAYVYAIISATCTVTQAEDITDIEVRDTNATQDTGDNSITYHVNGLAPSFTFDTLTRGTSATTMDNTGQTWGDLDDDTTGTLAIGEKIQVDLTDFQFTSTGATNNFTAAATPFFNIRINNIDVDASATDEAYATNAITFTIPDLTTIEGTSVAFDIQYDRSGEGAGTPGYQTATRTVNIVRPSIAYLRTLERGQAALTADDMAGNPAAPATCTITVDTFANLGDGENVVLHDLLYARDYGIEIDKAGDGVTAGFVDADIVGLTTNLEVAAAVTTAINTLAASDGERPSDVFIATDNLDGTITVTHRRLGTPLNTAGENTETLGGAGAITDFAGGEGFSTASGGDVGALVGYDSTTPPSVQKVYLGETFVLSLSNFPGFDSTLDPTSAAIDTRLVPQIVIRDVTGTDYLPIPRHNIRYSGGNIIFTVPNDTSITDGGGLNQLSVFLFDTANQTSSLTNTTVSRFDLDQFSITLADVNSGAGDSSNFNANELVNLTFPAAGVDAFLDIDSNTNATQAAEAQFWVGDANSYGVAVDKNTYALTADGTRTEMRLDLPHGIAASGAGYLWVNWRGIVGRSATQPNVRTFSAFSEFSFTTAANDFGYGSTVYVRVGTGWTDLTTAGADDIRVTWDGQTYTNAGITVIDADDFSFVTNSADANGPIIVEVDSSTDQDFDSGEAVEWAVSRRFYTCLSTTADYDGAVATGGFSLDGTGGTPTTDVNDEDVAAVFNPTTGMTTLFWIDDDANQLMALRVSPASDVSRVTRDASDATFFLKNVDSAATAIASAAAYTGHPTEALTQLSFTEAPTGRLVEAALNVDNQTILVVWVEAATGDIEGVLLSEDGTAIADTAPQTVVDYSSANMGTYDGTYAAGENSLKVVTTFTLYDGTANDASNARVAASGNSFLVTYNKAGSNAVFGTAYSADSADMLSNNTDTITTQWDLNARTPSTILSDTAVGFDEGTAQTNLDIVGALGTEKYIVIFREETGPDKVEAAFVLDPSAWTAPTDALSELTIYTSTDASYTPTVYVGYMDITDDHFLVFVDDDSQAQAGNQNQGIFAISVAAGTVSASVADVSASDTSFAVIGIAGSQDISANADGIICLLVHNATQVKGSLWEFRTGNTIAGQPVEEVNGTLSWDNFAGGTADTIRFVSDQNGQFTAVASGGLTNTVNLLHWTARNLNGAD
ncbi:MAG: hypothetical protein NUW37_10450 [Planctomycetes bacterium]|nr:hypothetical protein [Planctomycetota bacterium]